MLQYPHSISDMAALARPSSMGNFSGLPAAEIEPDDSVWLCRLVAEFALEDIRELSSSQKGKAKEGTPASDAEIALQLYAEEAEALQGTVKDHILAQSIDSALRTDHAMIQACMD
jgi:hypothetical protein